MSTRNFSSCLKHIKNNPYYGKYKSKIQLLEKASPEELMERIEGIYHEINRRKDISASKEAFSAMTPKESLAASFNFVKQKKLKDIMKVDLLEGKSNEEIQVIWEDYHKSKDMISTAVSTDNYEKMLSRGKLYPIFLFLVQRGDGQEFIVSEFSGNEIHFTPLITYQTYKENSPECLTAIHYTEFQDKGIVLMHADYNKDFLDTSDVNCLLSQFKMYYGEDNEKRINLLKKFTEAPRDFQYMDLIKEFDIIDKSLQL